MLRKKFFKILSVLVAVIVTSSLFCFSASAEGNQYNYSLNGLKITDMNVDIYDSAGNVVPVSINLWQPSPYNNRLEIYASRKDGANWSANSDYIAYVSINALPELVSSDNYVSGSFDLCTQNSYFTILNENYVIRQGLKTNGSDTDRINQVASLSSVVVPGGLNGYTCRFNNGVLGFSYSAYRIESKIHCNQSTKDFGIFICNIGFRVLSPDESAADELAHGWQSPGGLDTSISDDYHQKEEQILGGTASGRNDTISLFNNFGALFSTGYFVNGVTAVSRIMSKFIQIDWLSGLLQLSLSLGIFGFLIGTIQLVASRISSNKSFKSSTKTSKKTTKGGKK